jgi:hypothetical protein
MCLPDRKQVVVIRGAFREPVMVIWLWISLSLASCTSLRLSLAALEEAIDEVLKSGLGV